MCLIIKVYEKHKISGYFIDSAVFFKIAVQSAGLIVPAVLRILLLKLIFKKQWYFYGYKIVWYIQHWFKKSFDTYASEH